MEMTSHKAKSMPSSDEEFGSEKCTDNGISVENSIAKSMTVINGITFIVLVAAGVAAFIKKRRKYSPGNSTKTLDTTPINSNNSDNISSESHYERVDDISHKASAGAPVDYSGRCSRQCQALDINMSDFMTKNELMNTLTSDNNEYDILNLRVKPECIVDVTYDTSEKTVIKRKEKSSIKDDIYETVTIDGLDDPHNHSNDMKLKDIKTDIIYGVPHESKIIEEAIK